MKTSRREFLITSSLALGGAALLPGLSCAPQQKQAAAAKTGLTTAVQLYCVRDDMKADPLATLTKLAEMGYTYVEHANYVDHKFYGWTAAEFKKVLLFKFYPSI
jgi:hypothetical protein